MKTLKTVRLKPNPAGKDRTRGGGATQTQLGAEWVDIQNYGATDVDLSNVELYHVAYGTGHASGQWQLVITFTGILPAGKVMRVHSGSGPELALRQEDRAGADYHVFRMKDNYIWNNAEPDCSGLFLKGGSGPFERACYLANSPEGAVLVRTGDSLVVRAAA